jgi:hypothetical protein
MFTYGCLVRRSPFSVRTEYEIDIVLIPSHISETGLSAVELHSTLEKATCKMVIQAIKILCN